MSTEHEPGRGVPSEQETLRHLLNTSRYGSWRTSAFDEELFFEAFESLERRLQEIPEAQRHEVFQEMYFDAIPPSPQDRHSRAKKFVDEYVTQPIVAELSDVSNTLLRLETGAISALSGRDSDRRESRFIQYGPVRYIDVQPGEWAVQESGPYRVLGSSEFSGCQAIIARDGKKMALAHSLMGCEDEIPALVEALRKKMGPAVRLQFIYPQMQMGPDEQSDGWMNLEAESHNARYQRLGADQGMEVIPYYMPRAGYNPDDVGAITVLVGPEMLRVIGTRVQYDQKDKRWERLIRTQKEYE